MSCQVIVKINRGNPVGRVRFGLANWQFIRPKVKSGLKFWDLTNWRQDFSLRALAVCRGLCQQPAK